MTIPAEAVEAATDALVASKLGDHPGINGEEFVEAAMAALEAAAPYMLAGAWEQGHLAGSAGKLLEDEYPHLELTTNPYRPAE